MSKICEEPTTQFNFWKSNFSLCQDENYFSQIAKSAGKKDFGPHSQPPVKPARPPKPAQFMHKDVGRFNDIKSVTKSTFMPINKPKEPVCYESLCKTNWIMHGDVEKTDSYRPFQKTEFPPKYYSWRKPKTHVDTPKENILTGDRDKYKFWTSETKDNFVSSSCNQVERRPEPVYERSIIGKGDGRSTEYLTLHKQDFKHHQLPKRLTFYQYHDSHVAMGDREKVKQMESEQQANYKQHENQHLDVKDTKTAVYNKLFKTNIQGDLRLSEGANTIHKQYFQNYTKPVDKKFYDRNQCNVPKGDLDYKRGLSRVSQTTHKNDFIPYIYSDQPVKRHCSKMTSSDVTFGRDSDVTMDKYNTQQKQDFTRKKVEKIQVVRRPDDNIDLKYFKESKPAISLTSKDFVEYRAFTPHDNKKLSNLLQKCHIAPPNGEKINYQSSNRRDFPSREKAHRSPINMRLQTSSCPIGTLGNYIEGSNRETTGCQPPWVSEMKDSHRNYQAVARKIY